MIEAAVAVGLLAAAVSMVTAVVFLWRDAKVHGGQTQVLVAGKAFWVNLTAQEVESMLLTEQGQAQVSKA